MAEKSTERRIVVIGEVEDKNIDYSKKYRYDDIKIDSSKIDLCYLILHVDLSSKKNNISHSDVLMLLYLYELGMFSTIIELESGGFSLSKLYKKGFLEDDYSMNGKKLISLSASGVLLVINLLKSFTDSDKYVGVNRKAIMDDDSRATSVIDRYLESTKKPYPF
ncbi:hypothetical protein M1M25_gp053 [Tenacibaculum phage Gundel_1]|uniref:Uncharacterized protein n=1 Tax=Tenacibaculum phage Gundel_1 TaxID=2745672 RepID=A0A8E4ZMW4_9CAUD|nr:hypothetical protein M1M25_gp053 [Tenacibaculum phage Gundel_1]QQV91487.1 hypothetical protein Gundel1_53 [Tenacibaculum phage Gundel_1]